MSENIAAQTPRDEIVRTADRDARSGRKKIERVPVLNYGRIVHLTDIALDVAKGAGRVLARRSNTSKEQHRKKNEKLSSQFKITFRQELS
jgi:hypothetical protein